MKRRLRIIPSSRSGERIAPSVNNLKAKTARTRRVAKLLGTYNYTPQTARILAGVLCGLVEEPTEKRKQLLGIFQRVAEGDSK